MEIFKAEDARQLAENNSKSNFLLKKIIEEIKKAAGHGELQLMIRNIGFWRPNLLPEEKHVMQKLESMGYNVSHHEYNGKYYLKIKW